MTLRIHLVVGLALASIILPVIIVRAQAEGEIEAPPSTEVFVDETEAVADVAEDAPQESEAPTPSEHDGSVRGAETSTEKASSSGVGEESASSDPGSVGDQNASDPTTTADLASSTPPGFFTLDAASSTGSSTEPVEDPPAEPVDEPFVLQPAVTLHINNSSITAEIELQNLTCKSCGKVLPAAAVKTYYTPWYANDGPELKEVGQRYEEQEISVSDVALWSSRSMTWSANDVAPGRYYFVVVVDPENAIGSYRMHRSEFGI